MRGVLIGCVVDGLYRMNRFLPEGEGSFYHGVGEGDGAPACLGQGRHGCRSWVWYNTVYVSRRDSEMVREERVSE